MELTKEMINKAKSAKTAEELLKLAKAEGVEMTAEEAKKALAELNKAGELTDEELDNVSGGGCDSKYSPDGAVEHEKDVVHIYKRGQEVEVFYIGSTTKRAVITDDTCVGYDYGYYRPYYKVRYLSDNSEEKIGQYQIETR